MRCRECGCEVTPMDKYCPECGAKIENMTGYNIPPTPSSQPQTQPQLQPRPSSSGPIIMIIVVIILVLCVAIAFFAYFVISDKGDSTEDSQTEEITESSSEATTEEEVGEVPVWTLGYDSDFDLSGYTSLAVQAEATSYLTGGKYDYRGYRAMDGDDVSSWQTDEYPATLKAEFVEGKAEIKAIGFKLGNWRSSHYYNVNCTPSKLRITLGDYDPFELEFSYEKRMFVLEFSEPVKISEASFTIEDIFQGTETSDVCITEITIYEE